VPLTLPPIVDARWLRARRHDVVVCDVRWYLDGRSGHAEYAAGHLPGAVFIDLDRWLAAPASPGAGRHPLPQPEAFAEGMRRAGIANGATVIAYDDTGGGIAARLVWLLRACGERAALLDGGLTTWREPLSRVAAVITHSSFTIDAWPADRLADADQVAAAIADGEVVIDARAAERYQGRIEPVDPRAGHIPGAVNLPFAGNLAPSGHFLDPGGLRDRYQQVGVGARHGTIVYCGSGVTACHDLLAIEHAGLPAARLYPGSWSQWSADPERPVATSAAANGAR
jgi:thiosulfate/3-mercaptopyruvate sulfurtransferase